MHSLSRYLCVFLIGGSIATRVLAGPAMGHEVEPNDIRAKATPLGGDAVVFEGSISPAGDVDYYKFQASAGDRIYAATMTELSPDGTDTALDVLDTDGTVIESDNDNGSFTDLSSSVAGVPIPGSGVYFLRVRCPGGSCQVIPYRLFFQKRSGTPVPETEPNEYPVAQPLPASGYVSGATASQTDPDFFTIDLVAGDTVFISLDVNPQRNGTGWAAFAGFGVTPVSNTVLGTADPGAGGSDSQAMFMTVSASGKYYVEVYPYSTFGNYVLSVTVFPAANEGVQCATYTSTVVPATIPDVGAVASTLTVPGNPTIRDIDVSIKLNHTDIPDLDVTLTSPSGTVVPLFTDIGSPTFSLLDVTLDDEAAIPFGLYPITDGFAYTPELNYRLSWFDGEPAGGTWTLTVYDDTADSTTGELQAWSIRICEPLAPCNAGYSLQTLYQTDFESNIASFTHAGINDEWEVGVPVGPVISNCNSGSKCFKTDLDGTYEANSAQELYSGVVSLASISGPVFVEWAQKYQMDSAAFDHFFVEVSENLVPDNTVRIFEHDSPSMTATVGSSPTTINTAAGWSTLRRRIDSFAGKDIFLRFRVDSDGANNFAGAAIDDVKVVACIPLQLPPPTNLAATAGVSGIGLSWTGSLNATAYDIERRSSVDPNWGSLATGVAGTTFNDTTLISDDHAYVYRVRATAPSFPTSDFSKPDAASTFAFDDDPIAALVPIRATHISRLRAAVDALRIAVGLTAYGWTDDPVDGSVVRKVHIDDLRFAANEARSHIGIDAFVFATDPAITPQVTLVKAAHIGELRSSVR